MSEILKGEPEESDSTVNAMSVTPNVLTDSNQSESEESDNRRFRIRKWRCHAACKPLTDSDVDTIVSLRDAFTMPVTVRRTLQACDTGCPNIHLSYLVRIGESDSNPVCEDYIGHPLVCYDDSLCQSKLRILRSASTHYPLFKRFLTYLYTAIGNHKCILEFDRALTVGDYRALLSIVGAANFQDLLTTDSTYQKCGLSNQPSRKSSLESELMIRYADVINAFQKQIDDYPDHACCRCERLHQRKAVSVVTLSDELDSRIWPILRNFITDNDPLANDKVLYMCNYCKPIIRQGKLPGRCVLNGLQCVPVPKELGRLDQLSSQLIQRAKYYQTVVRLGTYTAKVPVYNSLKACKGTVFFLPLSLEQTMVTLNEVKRGGETVTLPNPELYIIVNGTPTKKQVVWRTLVNVTEVKQAVHKLRQINWLYRDVSDTMVDASAKQVIEVVNKASSKVLKRVSKEDVASFQCYTIRNLNSSLPTTSDIEQYKLLHVREEPVDNRQKHLDVMCFPTLFPTGTFGADFPRSIPLSNSEYIKSRLLNREARFRKNPQYIFYLLWQKEMREISAGIFNLLKSTKRQATSVRNLVAQLDKGDEGLEANLCKLFQSVGGTKQYWFLRQSEL